MPEKGEGGPEAGKETTEICPLGKFLGGSVITNVWLAADGSNREAGLVRSREVGKEEKRWRVWSCDVQNQTPEPTCSRGPQADRHSLCP